MLCKELAGAGKLSLAILVVALLAIVTAGQEEAGRSSRRNAQAPKKATGGATMSVARLPEDPSRHSLVISDGDESVVTATFTVDQLRLVRTIMKEARGFALSDEAVGSSEAITTRFSNPDVRSVQVDVLKFGNQSSLFVTLKTENGRLTVEAGTITRGDKKEIGPFFDVLARMESAVGGPPVRSP